MPKRFSTLSKEVGFVHIILLIVLVLGILGLVASSNITTTQKFSTPSSQVLGENESSQKATEEIKESAKINVQSEGNKNETEIETPSGQKIKIKVEDNGATKIEVENELKDEDLKDEEDKDSSQSDELEVSHDKAVQNLLSRHKIDKIENEVEGASSSAETETKNNEKVYKIKGEKKFKILGFIPVFVPTTAFVSTKNGDLVAEEQSLLANLIKLLSF